MKIDIKNTKGDVLEAIEVSDKIFGYEFNLDLIHQAVVSQDANARNQWAHTKGRGDVRGGGKKPWQQKGTGRARHGSIRSPLWIGGGVTFGPTKERSFVKKINKKMKKSAVFSVLSKRLADGEITVVDKIYNGDIKSLKTKDFVNILENLLNTDKMSVTLVFSNKNKSSHKFVRNLKGVIYISPTSLNAKDLLISKKIVIEKDAVNEILEHYKINSKV